MRKLLNPIVTWAVLAAVYVLFKSAQRNGIEMPLLHGWFSDVLCMPIVLGAVQFTIKLFRPTFALSGVMVAVAVIYFTLVFEWWLPQSSSIYTSDWLDVLCYALGGLAFYFYNFNRRNTCVRVAVE